MEVAYREFIVDEKLRQQRAREIGFGLSRSRGTTDGAPTTEEGATEDVTFADPASFVKSDPPASVWVFGAYAPQVCFTLYFKYFFH